MWRSAFTWVHFVSIWKEGDPRCHFVPDATAIAVVAAAAVPPLCLRSIQMYQAGCRIAARGGLFIPECSCTYQ